MSGKMPLILEAQNKARSSNTIFLWNHFAIRSLGTYWTICVYNYSYRHVFTLFLHLASQIIYLIKIMRRKKFMTLIIHSFYRLQYKDCTRFS